MKATSLNYIVRLLGCGLKKTNNVAYGLKVLERVVIDSYVILALAIINHIGKLK